MFHVTSEIVKYITWVTESEGKLPHIHVFMYFMLYY